MESTVFQQRHKTIRLFTGQTDKSAPRRTDRLGFVGSSRLFSIEVVFLNGYTFRLL
ncbi:hypothetical protein [Runella slithyformis]|uniref:Uncharacterized protein n=1 Tax=Runella slithyformis (strain ATCC 29530 / DSM 19594 / LMG 11500 / NCIMB 11436 / LSU 4) TaxID=761193 RepID=A0A7U3ZRG9_RUNSL|nr:hypothetical protein [Runella slithyformis]AEI51983.1 hypothetical protein Runsl_5694 [Runella slithyformis DSM 19594]